MIQTVIVVVLVLAAGFFLFRRVYSSISPKKECGGSCPACGEIGKERVN